jgi:hypothetical protein
MLQPEVTCRRFEEAVLPSSHSVIALQPEGERMDKGDYMTICNQQSFAQPRMRKEAFLSEYARFYVVRVKSRAFRTYSGASDLQHCQTTVYVYCHEREA